MAEVLAKAGAITETAASAAAGFVALARFHCRAGVRNEPVIERSPRMQCTSSLQSITRSGFVLLRFADLREHVVDRAFGIGRQLAFQVRRLPELLLLGRRTPPFRRAFHALEPRALRHRRGIAPR